MARSSGRRAEGEQKFEDEPIHEMERVLRVPRERGDEALQDFGCCNLLSICKYAETCAFIVFFSSFIVEDREQMTVIGKPVEAEIVP